MVSGAQRRAAGASAIVLMPRGRPPSYDGPIAAKRAANVRAARRARDAGIIQRSVALPASCWSTIRAARHGDETSDAQTLARIIGDLSPGVRHHASTTLTVIDAA